MLNRRVIEVNKRDTETVSARLDEVKEALAGELQGVDRLLYGGSVSKNTYVEGLSDIDALLVLDSAAYGDLAPEAVMAKLALSLRSHLNASDAINIESGDLAVTVTYKDGLQLQLLPAVERGKELSIKAASADSWTAIEPKRFAAALTTVNQAQAGAVVPAIKLAKLILARSPERNWPSGYHLEALALAAFETYNGPRNPKAMLTRLFDAAAGDVRRPIADLTGQSVHVDEALGPADSAQRRALSQGLGRIAARMQNARTAEAWQTLLGDDGP